MFGLAPVAAVPSMYSPLRYLTPVATEVRQEQEQEQEQEKEQEQEQEQ